MQECRDDGATDLKSTMKDMLNHMIIATYVHSISYGNEYILKTGKHMHMLSST